MSYHFTLPGTVYILYVFASCGPEIQIKFYTADVNSLYLDCVPLLNQRACQLFRHCLACLGIHLFNLALFWLSQIHTAGLTFVSGSYLNLSCLFLLTSVG